VAGIRGAEIFYSKRVNFVTKAYFRPPDPAADQLQIKEMQRATDGGAMVIVIQVENPAQAQQAVQRAYYPPMGARDLGPGQYDIVYPASLTGGNYVGTYNSNLVLIANIGTVAGVSQAKMIAATAGISALYVDTMNLESDSGYGRGTPDFNKLLQFVQVSALASKKYMCTANRTATPNTLTCMANPYGLTP
jgi:2-keto-3-deoxy-L-rhamnonate aldolase RhmA